MLNVLSRFNVGGTAPWLLYLSTGLSKRGIENLSLIGKCPASEIEDSRISALRYEKIDGLGPGASLTSTIRAFLEVRIAIKKFRPNIVNTHTSRAGVIGRLAAIGMKPRVTVVHTFHGHVLRGYFGRIKVRVIKRIEKSLARHTDFFFIVGESVRKDLVHAGIINSANSLSVWPAVKDLDPSDSPLQRSSLGIPNDAVVLGWLGRKAPIKRLDRLIELAVARPNIFFLVAGAGIGLQKMYPKLFKSRKYSNIIELGYTKPEAFWKIVDVGILTSDNEGIPSAPIEAALAEKPSIITNVGSTNEVLIPGVTGYLCDISQVSLLSAIDELAHDKSLRLRMGKSARKFVLVKFNADRSVEQQINGYKTALKLVSQED